MALLEVRGVSVRFGGLLALDSAEIEVEPNRVTGLIGPNGAGKTTLFNVVTGLQHPTHGRVVLDGADITHMRPHKRARRGISRTFQRIEVFGSLSTRENLLVALEMRRRWSKERYSPNAEVDRILELIGIESVAEESVDSLPTGTARLVELGRALAMAPKVLLLDEPSSGLDDNETDDMGELLVRLADDGLAVLLVEHDMAFVMGVCAHIDVLDFGRIIARGTPEEIRANPSVQRAYLGTGAHR